MQPEFHFILPVWGQLYIDMFLKVTLPCQLSPGNLGFFKGMYGRHKYKIFTMSEHVAAIEESESYKMLSGLIETEIRTFDDLVDKSKIKYEIMSACHGTGFREAGSDGNVYVVTLVSDSLVSDGSFRRFYELAVEGKRAVVIGNFRVGISILPELIEKFFSESAPSITVPARELMRLSVAAVHHNSKMNFWDSPEFSHGWPAYLFWSVGDEGVLMRGLHLHPIVICPARKDEVFDFSSGMAIDGSDFIERSVRDLNDVYISTDSDEIAIPAIDYTDPCDSCRPAAPLTVRILSIALWMKKYCCGYSAHYIRTKIRHHSGDISSNWDRVERESDEIVGAILGALEYLSKLPAELVADLEVQIGKIMHPPKQEISAKTAFTDIMSIIRKGEELVNQGQPAAAHDIFSNLLHKLDKAREITINNIAVMHAQEGKLKTAEYLLNYLQGSGNRNDTSAANLDMIRLLMKNHPELGEI